MVLAIRQRDALTAPEQLATRLTMREQHVLALSSTGWSSVAIANALDLTPEAVSGDIASIIAKVGVRSRIEAVLVAVRNGLIELPAEPNSPDTRTPGHQVSAVRPMTRLLRWGEVDQLNARRPVTPADDSSSVIEMYRGEIADVDGAAT